MTIQEIVNKTLVETRDKDVKSALRILKAELQREKTKEVDNARVVKVIQTLIASEKERLEKLDVFKRGNAGEKEKGVKYIHILSGLLPVQVGAEQIRDFINDTLNLSEFKNPMMAMKFILDHFGKENVNSETARAVILNIQTEPMREKFEEAKLNKE